MNTSTRREWLRRLGAIVATLTVPGLFVAAWKGFKLRENDDRIVYRITKPEWAPGFTLNSQIRWEDQRPGDVVEYVSKRGVADDSNFRWRIIRHLDDNTVALEQVDKQAT